LKFARGQIPPFIARPEGLKYIYEAYAAIPNDDNLVAIAAGYLIEWLVYS
jgi:hypothetical protein